MDERDDYLEKDLPPPKAWVMETLVSLGVILFVLGLAALAVLYSVATGPQFDD